MQQLFLLWVYAELTKKITFNREKEGAILDEIRYVSLYAEGTIVPSEPECQIRLPTRLLNFRDKLFQQWNISNLIQDTYSTFLFFFFLLN